MLDDAFDGKFGAFALLIVSVERSLVEEMDERSEKGVVLVGTVSPLY